MGEQGTALRALIGQRHLSYGAFCREWDRVAKRMDEALLIGHYPGRAQYHRWLRGELVNKRPYPDACRVLEAMFPGWSVERLFSPYTGGNPPDLFLYSQAGPSQVPGDGNGKTEARMPYTRSSLRREKRELRESMREAGLEYRQIATEFARVYKLRPRAAWREAYGWSLQDAADKINAYRGNVGLDPGGLSGMTSAHLCEYENWPGYGEPPSGRRPSPYLLAVLASIYGCQVGDLIDLADRKHLPKADLLVIDTYSPSRGQGISVSHSPGKANDGGEAETHESESMLTGVSVSPVELVPARSDVQPILRNMSRISALPAIAALRQVQQGYVIADRLMGALSVSDAIRTQVPVVEMACEVTRGADRAEALAFACRFMEFCGWIHQDAGDLTAAMFWTDRAFDYAIELGDRRTIAYTLMRKSSIATEAGNPAQGLGIANFALSDPSVLTPRLRAVILRQRAHAYAALHEPNEVERDADNALAEAVAGMNQGEEDRAPYCSPMYVAMETGQSMVVAGRSHDALSVLARSHSEWSDRSQVRDYALCVSRLATAYAAAGDPEQACDTAGEAINLAYGIGSRRVVGQLVELLDALGTWRNDPVISATRGRLSTLVDSFKAG